MAAERAGAWRRWKRWRVVVFFLLGLAALNRALATRAGLWLAYDPETYRKRLEGCRERPRDVVIVGGSPTMCGLDPAALVGLEWRGRRVESAFNAALPLATTTEVWHATEHGLPAPPRLLVYGITATDLNEDRVEVEGPRALMDARDVAAWGRLRPEAAAWCARNYAGERVARLWQLYYYREGIRAWAADRAEALRPGLCPEAAAEARGRLAYGARVRGGGFIAYPAEPRYRLDCRKAEGSIDPAFGFLVNYQIGGAHLACLHKLLDWGEAHQVPVVLLDMPVSADLEERLWPGPFVRYHEVLAEVERARRVPVLRATREAVGLTDADFTDWVHLNAAGTDKVSRWLRKELAATPEGAGPAALARDEANFGLRQSPKR